MLPTLDFSEKTEEIQIDTVTTRFPSNLRKAVEELVTEKNNRVKLQTLCLTIIPLTFQYIAIVLSSEYLFSDAAPSLNVTESLWDMVNQPGPGKWLKFIRESIEYFTQNSPKVVPYKLILEINDLLISKRKPTVKFINEDKKTIKKLDYFSALVNVRNIFAHFNGLSEKTSKKLFEDYIKIWVAVIKKINEIFTIEILVKEKSQEKYISLTGEVKENLMLSNIEETINTWNGKENKFLKVYPMVIPPEKSPQTQDDTYFALLFEEIKGRKITYTWTEHIVRKQEEYSKFLSLLEKKTIPLPKLVANELNVAKLIERITHHTNIIIERIINKNIFLPEIYIEREKTAKELSQWLNSQEPGCILYGKPGVGKTNFVANWAIQQNEKGDHVLLIEASKLKTSDIKEEIKKFLQLGTYLNNFFYFISTRKGNNNNQFQEKFIFIIDGLNEFSGDENDNRLYLWREINSFLDYLKDFTPQFKLLVTTRIDLWKKDFPNKKAVANILKRSLFYGI
jgi:hypothetical protein